MHTVPRIIPVSLMFGEIRQLENCQKSKKIHKNAVSAGFFQIRSQMVY